MKVRFFAVVLGLGMVAQSFAAKVPFQDVVNRYNNKSMVSIFQPWANLTGGIVDTSGGKRYDFWDLACMHDLIHNSPKFWGLQHDKTITGPYDGDAIDYTPESIQSALELRARLLQKNPDIILIGEVRFYDADTNYLSPTSDYWIKNTDGTPQENRYVPGYFNLNWKNNANFRKHVTLQCRALLETGVVDGIFLDWANGDRSVMIKEIRDSLGPDAILIGNVNHYKDLTISRLLNGVFMEGTNGMGTTYLDNVESCIVFQMTNLQVPKIICNEVWADNRTGQPGPTEQMDLLRAGTAITLINSIGYYIYSYGAHVHAYYPFWNAAIGTPLTPKLSPATNVSIREFTNATIVYNRIGNAPYTITFTDTRKRQSTGETGTSFSVKSYDGEIFMKGDYPTKFPGVRPLPLPVEDTKVAEKVTHRPQARAKPRYSVAYIPQAGQFGVVIHTPDGIVPVLNLKGQSVKAKALTSRGIIIQK